MAAVKAAKPVPPNRKGTAASDPAIGINDGWFATTDEPPAFFWTGGGTPFNDDGPYTYSSTGFTVVRVTDDFQCGDQFRVFDNGVSLGTTSVVPVDATCGELGPDDAFADPAHSHGSFVLPPGSHAITIQAIVNPFSGGRGYLRVDADQSLCANPPPPPPGAIIATPGVVTTGTSGDDIIYGTSGDDKIDGGGGNDQIFGLGGNDQITGGAGNDLICGGDGNDFLSGGPGNDIISGDAGNDRLSGGPGDDQLFGGPGADQLSGGDGTDTCTGGGNTGDLSASCETVNP